MYLILAISVASGAWRAPIRAGLGGEGEIATSNFAEFLFHALGCVEAKSTPHALGESGWLNAFGLEAYAPRGRGEPEALQGELFSYLEAL